MTTNPSDALRVVVGLAEKATPDWRGDRFGVIRAGEFRQYVNGTGQSQIASFTADCDDPVAQRDTDTAFALAAVNFIREHGAALAQALENDARYRWLRDKSFGQREHPIAVSQRMAPFNTMQYIGPLAGESLDAAIDSAIAAQQKEAQ